MEAFIELIKEYPWFANLVMIIGTLRVVMKPLFSLIDAVTAATPNKQDDAAWKGVKESKAMSLFIWLIDYVASVKVPKKNS